VGIGSGDSCLLVGELGLLFILSYTVGSTFKGYCGISASSKNSTGCEIL